MAMFGTSPSGDDFAPVSSLVALLLFFPYMAVTWRRLHDTGKSGWWVGAPYVIAFALVVVMFATQSVALAMMVVSAAIPLALLSLVYTILVFVFLCTRGDPGRNHYG